MTVRNPGAKHSLGVGILQRCKLTFEGSLGYFACGLIDGPEVHITGRVGWSACENMMSGVVEIDGNAGSLTAAALRGGDVVVHGQVGARTGIDQKGGTIIILGDVGSMTGFMMQRVGRSSAGTRAGSRRLDVRRRVLCGPARSPRSGSTASRRVDRADTELVSASSGSTASAPRPEFQKFVCGKKLYNYDSLEPSERKLVL